MPESLPALWDSRDVVAVPNNATAAEIAGLAQQLTPRELVQVIQAYDTGAYEIGSTYIWTRTMAGLKRQLAALGVEFVAEMLDRPDIRPGSDISEVLTDYDAVSLAEDLGMFGSKHALRLRHSLETLNYFASPHADGDDEGMTPEEAIGALRTCVQTVLGHEDLTVALEFAGFRKRLESETLTEDWLETQNIQSLPYFFIRTTVRVLLAGIRTSEGARLEILLANLNTLLPVLWPTLMDPDRYAIGQLYADMHADGQSKAASGVRSALVKVAGFDYVPETLRSKAFFDAARRLLATHQDWDNFRNEPGPMRALVALGATVPISAFPKCMTAVLAVRLGNQYGWSYDAQPDAKRFLDGVTVDRWRYYLEECLPGDEVVLGKLTASDMADRWIELVRQMPRLRDAEPNVNWAIRFLEDSIEGDEAAIRGQAKTLSSRLRGTDG